MKHAEDFNCRSSYSVRNQIPGLQNYQLARSGNSSRTSDRRLIGEHCYRVQDTLDYEPGRFRIFGGNELGFVFKVRKRLAKPSNLH